MDADAKSKPAKPEKKTYRIPVSNGIFEHYRRMRDSYWLFTWYIDKTTKESEAGDGGRVGVVLGGLPIRDSDAASAFGCSEKTARNWRTRLAREGYIEQKRTPVGYVIRVLKSKKWLKERPAKNCRSDRQEITDHSRSELPFVADQIDNDRHSDRQRSAIPDQTLQNRTVDGAGEEAAAAWEDIELKPVGTPKFQQAWVHYYRNGPDDALLADLMEEAIQFCQRKGIPVPPPFFTTKRKLERPEPPKVPNIADLRPSSL